jgi:4'-phosphopantetheinyl transferase
LRKLSLASGNGPIASWSIANRLFVVVIPGNAEKTGNGFWIHVICSRLMRSRNCLRTLACPLELRREDRQLKGRLVFVFGDQAYSIDELADEVLGAQEAAYFATLRHEIRQNSYLLGRYAAKLALSELFSEPDLQAIEVVRGVFEQPIVQYARNSGYGVTISHAGPVAVALGYPAGHPMGIDIERLDRARYETIVSQLSDREMLLVETAGVDRLGVATAFWTAKEALAKVLTTGLMTPFQVYNLGEFRLTDAGTWEGLFQNFAQYKVKAWIGSLYAFAMVLPKRSELHLTEDLRQALSLQ